jgi:hypothetical protein
LTPGAFDTVNLGGVNPWDGFVSVIRLPDALVASTLLGGDHSMERLYGVSADSRGIVAVGETYSYDFPVTPDAFSPLLNGNGNPSDYSDAFAVRLDTTLSHMEYGTFLGGWHVEYVYGSCFVSPDRVWIAGQTGSSNFPVTPNAFQTTNQGFGDGFMLEFEVPVPSSVPPSVHPLPDAPQLSVYPNPFNSQAVIRYSLPRQAQVDLEVFDVLGRVVNRWDLGNVSAGSYSRSLDFGTHASGTYLVRLRTPDHAMTTKIVLVR